MTTKRAEAENKPAAREVAEGRINYPFTAIVGQDKMKLGLILNAINPQIGGVLIRGERGTGKTIAVRGLADVLPMVEVVADCRFRCNPADPSEMCSICRDKYDKGEKLPKAKRKMHIAELPVGATEDRVIGTLNIEKAIKEGIKALDPGILADANRGILYVDNVNLLDDHVVDVLLDSAAMGVNIVEREGVSVSHPAKFILIGTMNPEEGELRPQLHDRYALQMKVDTIRDVKTKLEILERVTEFERDPMAFIEKWSAENAKLTEKIIEARKLLPKVQLPLEQVRIISRMCAELDVDGHRPDIIIARAAMTKAAFEGRTEVTEEDIRTAAELTLNFRMRRTPFEEATLDSTKFQQVLDHAKQMEEQYQVQLLKSRKAKVQLLKSRKGKKGESRR